MSIFKKFANMARRSNINAIEKRIEHFDKLDAGDYSHTCLNCHHCHYYGSSQSRRGPYSCHEHDLELTENEIKTYRCKDFDPKYWFATQTN